MIDYAPYVQDVEQGKVMTKEEEEMMKLQYTYNELMSTFLAGSTMLSNNHTSWREAFSKWMTTILKHKKEDALDLS